MIWKWISRIPVIVKWIDSAALKWAAMRTAQEELGKTRKEVEKLEDMLIKEVEKRQRLEQQSLGIRNAVKEAMRNGVKISFEVIKEHYHLVPKYPTDFQDALQSSRANALGFKQNILGQTHNITKLSGEDKSQENADK